MATTGKRRKVHCGSDRSKWSENDVMVYDAMMYGSTEDLVELSLLLDGYWLNRKCFVLAHTFYDETSFRDDEQ